MCKTGDDTHKSNVHNFLYTLFECYLHVILIVIHVFTHINEVIHKVVHIFSSDFLILWKTRFTTQKLPKLFLIFTKNAPNSALAYPHSRRVVNYFVDKSISMPLITKFFLTLTRAGWKTMGSAKCLVLKSPVSQCPLLFSSKTTRTEYVAGLR